MLSLVKINAVINQFGTWKDFDCNTAVSQETMQQYSISVEETIKICEFLQLEGLLIIRHMLKGEPPRVKLLPPMRQVYIAGGFEAE